MADLARELSTSLEKAYGGAYASFSPPAATPSRNESAAFAAS